VAPATETAPSAESVAAEMIVDDLTQNAPKAPIKVHVNARTVASSQLLSTCLNRSLREAGFQVLGTGSSRTGDQMDLEVRELKGTAKLVSVEIVVLWAPKAGYIIRLRGNAKSNKRELIAQAKHA
jgi:hypothetical protein